MLETLIKSDIRKHTHKNNKEEVFVCQMRVKSESEFVVRCNFNNCHRHFNDVINSPHFLNPMLLLECCRQAETYIAHQIFGLDEDSKFVLKNWGFSVIKESYKSINAYHYNSLDIHVTSKKSSKIDKKLRSNQYEFHITIGELIIAESKFNVLYVDSSSYSKLRGQIATETYDPGSVRLRPQLVGYMSSYNSILSKFEKLKNKYRALINVNLSNITFNDHYQDHITGMNIVEASKQICFSYLSSVMGVKIYIYKMNMLYAEYYSYVEINYPSYVEIDELTKSVDGNYVFELNVLQRDIIKAKCKVCLMRF